MKDKKGITLIALIITVIILSILASVATYSGINVIKSSQLTAFTTELKIMQTQVNRIYQEKEENQVYGKDITGEIETQARKVFTTNESGITSYEGYRYWDKDTKKELKIEGVEQDFFVNLEKRSIVSYKGFEYEGTTYYTLEQLPDGLYNVEYENVNTTKPTFKVTSENIGTNKWRLTVSEIQYDGYINKWQVRYRLEDKTYWETTEDLSFVVNTQGKYMVQLVNGDVISEEREVIAVEGYVKDGLQLYYDGIRNTRSGNNPTATSWEDLSGNNNDGVFYNMNTNPNTVTPTTTGYYSPEENGYVFLHNDSYVMSKNNIGITGDAKFTIEAVTTPWEEGKNPNYTAYSAITPVWWGTSNTTVGSAAVFSYNRSSKKISCSFINNGTSSNGNYDLIGKTSYMSFRKTKTGEITTGVTDIGKISYNGQNLANTYTGAATFTTNLLDAKVQVGRSWQYNNQNRTVYGSIQAVRIYNRVLTDEEVQQNYEIDKIRFHIQ